jgi:pimeloyl-ACP methyl ester carboxylesterase
MGGWIALLVALGWKRTLNGLVGIAAAPDFSEEIYNRLTPAQKESLEKTGRVSADNHYSNEPYAFTRTLYLEAKNHILLDKKHPVEFPIRLIQGMLDRDVPWQTAMKIQEAFTGSDVDVVMVEDGEHRLSRPGDLELIDREIRSICETCL